MQLSGKALAGTWPRAGIAPPVARAIVGADSGERGDSRLHEGPVQGRAAQSGIEYNGWRASAGAMDMQTKGTDTDQPSRRRGVVERPGEGLAANQEERQHQEPCRVKNHYPKRHFRNASGDVRRSVKRTTGSTVYQPRLCGARTRSRGTDPEASAYRGSNPQYWPPRCYRQEYAGRIRTVQRHPTGPGEG